MGFSKMNSQRKADCSKMLSRHTAVIAKVKLLNHSTRSLKQQLLHIVILGNSE